MIARASAPGVATPVVPASLPVALALLTLLALAVRVWDLERSPPGLFTDEAAVAYNAYSIALTGRDEYGHLLPLALRSFGDYKRPAYVYFSAPFVAAMGLTPFSARLPGALLGVACVPLLYLLGRGLLRNRRAALLGAALLAVSPWSVHLSRAGHEASSFLAPALGMAVALLAALHATPGRAATVWCAVAALAMLLSVYGYHSGVVAPLLALAILLAYGERARRLPRAALLVGLAVSLAGLAPWAQQVRDGRATARAAQISLLAQGWIAEEAQARAARNARDLSGPPAAVVGVMDSRWAILGREAAAAYLSHFAPPFLFTRGDAEPRHHAAGLAQLYLWEAPLVLLGLAALARGWQRPGYRVLAAWLLLAPLPASLAENAPHALRSYAMAPALALLGGLGAHGAWRWAESRAGALRSGAAAWAAVGLLLVFSGAYLAKAYGRDVPLEQDRAWSSGWHEAFALALAEVQAGRARRIVVPPEVREGYIFALVASRYDPRAYLAQGGSRVSEDWPLSPEPGPMTFAPWEVRVVEWEREPRSPETLYLLGSWNQRPADARVLAITRGASGREALAVFRLG